MHINISLAPENVFNLWGFPITNSLIASYMVSGFLITVAFLVSRRLKAKPGGAQSLFELIYEWLSDTAVSIGGHDALKFLPLVLTIFMYILLANWIGLLPGFGSIGVWEVEHGVRTFVPIFRGATADINATLALAIISVFAIQFFGVGRHKFSYIKRFINLSSPINFFTGILEIISEFAKVVSFSFRLFGNIFAGEVLLAVIVGLAPILAPLPFFGMEIFVGFIQALVFAVLTLVFIHMGTIVHDEGSDHIKKDKKSNSHKTNVILGKEVEYGG